MENVVLSIHLILALLLIGVVLLQRSEGGGLGMGSSSGTGVMTGRQAANALTKLTWALAAAFIVTSMALTVLSAHKAGVGSVVDRFMNDLPPATSTDAPALPQVELPPPSAGTTDAPVTPPAAN